MLHYPPSALHWGMNNELFAPEIMTGTAFSQAQGMVLWKSLCKLWVLLERKVGRGILNQCGVEGGHCGPEAFLSGNRLFDQSPGPAGNKPFFRAFPGMETCLVLPLC